MLSCRSHDRLLSQSAGSSKLMSKLIIDVDARGIARLTLSRPEKGNAVDTELLHLLAAALQRLRDDRTVRVVVLRGEGRHFCTGADVSGAAGIGGDRDDTGRVGIAEVCGALNAFPKPTIAVIHGACLGGGLALAASCDVRLATPDAFFAIPEVRLGFAPLSLMPFFLAACEPRFLRRYLLSGERFDATRAAAAGLLHDIRDAADLDAALADLLEAFLLAGPSAVAAAKAALLDLAANPGKLPDPAEAEAVVTSDEAREGLASFREKRRPNWYPSS
jgi:methylglutaconyl-CoA hydratase